MREVNEESPLGAFPLGSHDSWQYHFYCFEHGSYFSIRMWASKSVKQAWAWTMNSEGRNTEMISYLDNCEFENVGDCSTIATNGKGDKFKFTEHSHKTHAGLLEVAGSNGELIRVEFTPNSVHSWHVPGRDEGVFHFPDLSATITYDNKTFAAVGYCKRYWGNYDGPWGYQFIQGAAADKSKVFWTADATFGDFEYNYFKVYDPKDKSLVSAEKVDTWHNNQRAFWRPLDQPHMDVELKEQGKMEFHLVSDKQRSKLVERFGPVLLRKNGEVVFEGMGFNEVCFGTVG
jgi:hypothetical protein